MNSYFLFYFITYFLPVLNPLPLIEVRELHRSFWEIFLPYSIPYHPAAPSPPPSIAISSEPRLSQLESPGTLNLGQGDIIWVPGPSQSLTVQIFPQSLDSLSHQYLSNKAHSC